MCELEFTTKYRYERHLTSGLVVPVVPQLLSTVSVVKDALISFRVLPPISTSLIRLVSLVRYNYISTRNNVNALDQHRKNVSTNLPTRNLLVHIVLYPGQEIDSRESEDDDVKMVLVVNGLYIYIIML